MANQDRIERYSKVRTWLDGPYNQKPSPHQILNQMLTVEQTLNLRLTNTRTPWNLISLTLTTVADQSVYEIDQPVALYQNSGKVHFVIRSTGNAELPQLPVPFDDFSSMNYGEMPQSGDVNRSLSVPEKISFYRTDMQDQVFKAVIQPVPQEVLTYTIYFFTGSLDRSQALMSSTGPVTELSDYLDLKAALALLPYSESRDDDQFNISNRQSLATGIGMQIAELEPIVEKYIKDLNAPRSFDMDHCLEGRF